jgi:hypothetical protein|tara:strand:- start:1524 stop:2456 length:933 start_codon:yes stop_codon:yes gene_type:complete
MSEPIKIPLPENFTVVDTASQQQFQELLVKAGIDPVVINLLVNDVLSQNGVVDSAIDSSVAVLSELLAETGLIEPDSAHVLTKRVYYDVINERNLEIDNEEDQKDLGNAATVGNLIGMENATEYLRQSEINKDAEFQQIKDLYGLGDKATEDEAYGLLLNDLTANELESVYNSQQGLQGTYKSPSGKQLTREQMMPIPLSTTKPQSYSYYGGRPSMATYNSKMTKEEFRNFIRNDRFNYLSERQRTGGLKMDFEKTAAAADEYASSNLDDNYDTYRNYQREILKDIDATALDGALTRLEAAKEVKAIFTE